MTTNIHNNSIRIIELPQCRAATSKNHDLKAFDQWWSALDRMRADKFFPRDFMYFDKDANELVWLYALPDGADGGPYDVVDFAGGLYAAAISRDQDDADGERVFGEIKAWVTRTAYFNIDESAERPTLFHIITSDAAFAKMNYRQLDIFVPIR